MRIDLTPPTVTPRTKIWIPAVIGFVLGILALLQIQSYIGNRRQPVAVDSSVSESASTRTATGGSTTNIYAHNLRLHQGPNFRVYISWLRGQLMPSHPGVVPSFDDPESFYLNVTNGVIRANMGDMSNYLNGKSATAPLTNIRMTGEGDQVKLTGNFHKGITLPVEILGVLKPASNNRIQIQVSKINILKIPMKALLGGLHLPLSSLLPSGQIPGVEVVGNDIFFDSNKLLPPPYIKGTLTKVSLLSPDLEAVYGDVTRDVARVEEWRNFLRLQNGTLNFGKLTMKKVDLIMIDISQDYWFDLDIAHYQDQLVNGYTRMTPTQGLQIFMPDASEVEANHITKINIEWFKNRNVAAPTAVVPSNH